MIPIADLLKQTVADLERTARAQHMPESIPAIDPVQLYAELDDRISVIERKLGIEPTEPTEPTE